MSTVSRRRLFRDLKKFQGMKKGDDDGVNAAPFDDDIMKWEAVIYG